jgi:hypothetical protein
MPSLSNDIFGSGTSVSVGMGCGTVGVASGEDCAGVAVASCAGVGDGASVAVAGCVVATIVTGTAAGVDGGVDVVLGVLPAHAESAMAAMKINPVSLRIESSLPCSSSVSLLHSGLTQRTRSKMKITKKRKYGFVFFVWVRVLRVKRMASDWFTEF